MYLCYVDESGDPGERGSHFLVLTGVAIFEGKWRQLRDEFSHLIDRYWSMGGTRPTEIHLSELRQARGPYRTLTSQQRTDLVVELCAIATRLLSTEIRAFTVIADKRAWFHQHVGKNGDDLYVEMFEQLASRFDMYLRRRHSEGAPSKGVIIADPHKKQLTRALQTQHVHAQLHGNQWSSIYNLIETIFFLHSHESPGLQLADLFSYAVWRLVATNDPSVAHRLAGCFDREPTNSAKNPGKWHGVKGIELTPPALAIIRTVWPP